MIPIVDSSKIKEEYKPVYCAWHYYYSFRIEEKLYYIVAAFENKLAKEEWVFLEKDFQNAIEIRYGAYMNGYMDNDKHILFENAKEYFENNPQYDIGVL